MADSNLDNLNLVSSSKYDIYSKLLAIAGNYTDVENEDFLKTGLFGYVTESMASMARDSSIQKSMLYNESFLNTAIMPKSVYNWAKMFGIDVTKATPAYTYMTVRIPISSLVEVTSGVTRDDWDDTSFSKYGSDLSSILNTAPVLILDKSNTFKAGEYEFSMERSIIIYQKKTESNANGVWLVKQCATDSKCLTSYQTFDNKFLSSRVVSISGIQYLEFSVRVYQYKVEEETRQITSSSFLATKIHDFAFDDQLVGMTLTYQKNGVSKDIELRYSEIGDSDSDTPYAFYNLSDPNTLQIRFSDALGGFVPSVNSALIMRMAVTKGAAGNISYTGDVLFRLADEKRRNLPISATFSESYGYMAYGGEDAPTLSKIKNTIIKQISTRDVIVTENDLNNYFESLIQKVSSSNIGGITFVKKRDDILRRIFSSYVLLRDGLGTDNKISTSSGYVSKVIPTNTIDANFSITSSQGIPFGAPITLKSGTTDEYQYISNRTDGTDNAYIIPFYMLISLSPFRKVRYIYNLANDSSSMIYKSVSQSKGYASIAPISASLRRELEGVSAQNYYTAEFSFRSNFSMQKEYTGSGNEIDLMIYSESGSTVLQESKYANSDIEIVSEQDSTDESYYKNTITMTIKVEDDEFGFNGDGSKLFGEYLKAKIGSNTDIDLPEKIRIGIQFKNFSVSLPSGDDDVINSEFQSSAAMSLFRPLDKIMISDLNVNTKTDGTITSIDIKDIPVIHKSYFASSDGLSESDAESKVRRFISTMFAYFDMLSSNLSKLEANTFFDMKFYNTYGPAKINSTLKTNLDLELDVYLAQGIENTSDIQTSIKDYVRRVVDSLNQYETIKVSSIIKSVLTEFSGEIDHIDFKGLNGTFSQYIKRLTDYDSSKEIPEYLNIQAGSLDGISVHAYNGN